MLQSSEHTKLIVLPLRDGGTLGIEVPNVPDEVEIGADAERGGSAPAKRVDPLDFERAVGHLGPVADGVMGALNGATWKPSEVTVEFDVRFSAKAGVPLVLVTAGAEASLKVRLTWRPDRG